jgi:hypothetical protein
VVVWVRDRAGLPLADAKVSLVDAGGVLAARRTYSDGRALLFPSELKHPPTQGARVRVEWGKRSTEVPLGNRRHTIDVRLEVERAAFQRVPLDIAFLLDTTGSMGDEIAELKRTLQQINFQISHLAPRPDLRFGMVLYKDRGEDYRTRVVGFSASVDGFARELAGVEAGGGGDEPEDVQAGLEAALTQLTWRSKGVRLLFLIGDAQPHLDYGQGYTYTRAMREAAAAGIKIATIGASGLPRAGELVWRQLAQYTMAPFVFLTYGEKGDSEGGAASTVSHHVGANWVAENLDAIVVRLVKLELSHYSAKGAPLAEDYFTAQLSERLPPDDVLGDLFAQSVKQLGDYCVQRLADKTPTVVPPVRAAEKSLEAKAKKLEAQLLVSLGRARELQLVESRDLDQVMKTLGAQASLKYDSAKVAELGKLVPAKLAVLSQLERDGATGLQMLIKLVRLETGEILSLSLLKIDDRLLSAKR